VDICGALRMHQQTISKKLSLLTQGKLGSSDLEMFLSQPGGGGGSSSGDPNQAGVFETLCQVSTTSSLSTWWPATMALNLHGARSSSSSSSGGEEGKIRMHKSALKTIIETLSITMHGMQVHQAAAQPTDESPSSPHSFKLTSPPPPPSSSSSSILSSLWDGYHEPKSGNMKKGMHKTEEGRHSSSSADNVTALVEYALIRFDNSGSGESLDENGFKKLLEMHSRQIVGGSLEHLVVVNNKPNNNGRSMLQQQQVQGGEEAEEEEEEEEEGEREPLLATSRDVFEAFIGNSSLSEVLSRRRRQTRQARQTRSRSLSVSSPLKMMSLSPRIAFFKKGLVSAEVNSGNQQEEEEKQNDHKDDDDDEASPHPPHYTSHHAHSTAAAATTVNDPQPPCPCSELGNKPKRRWSSFFSNFRGSK
jgi:hypothetical protein